MTFEDFLNDNGYEATSFIDPLINKLVYTINRVNYLSLDLELHPKFSKLRRMYHMSKK